MLLLGVWALARDITGVIFRMFHIFVFCHFLRLRLP